MRIGSSFTLSFSGNSVRRDSEPKMKGMARFHKNASVASPIVFVVKGLEMPFQVMFHSLRKILSINDVSTVSRPMFLEATTSPVILIAFSSTLSAEPPRACLVPKEMVSSAHPTYCPIFSRIRPATSTSFSEPSEALPSARREVGARVTFSEYTRPRI